MILAGRYAVFSTYSYKYSVFDSYIHEPLEIPVACIKAFISF